MELYSLQTMSKITSEQVKMIKTNDRVVLAGLKAIGFEPTPDPTEISVTLKSKRKLILEKLCRAITKKEPKNTNQIMEAMLELVYLPTKMAEDFVNGILAWEIQINIWRTLMERIFCNQYDLAAKRVPDELAEKFLNVALIEKKCPYEEANEIYKLVKPEQSEDKEKYEDEKTQNVLSAFDNAVLKLETYIGKVTTGSDCYATT